MPLRLTGVELQDVAVRLEVRQAGEWVSLPVTSILARSNGFFFHTEKALANSGSEARIRWSQPPFGDGALDLECVVNEKTGLGLDLRFSAGPPSGYDAWLRRFEKLVKGEMNYSHKAVTWHGWGAILSSGGLVCGAVGLFLPNFFSGVEKVAWTLLGLMIFSIACFAGTRYKAMRMEQAAIQNGEV